MPVRGWVPQQKNSRDIHYGVTHSTINLLKLNKLHLLFLLALALTVGWRVGTASQLFTYRHGFVSADVCVAARNFSREGVLALSGVPFNNNPPLCASDAYMHWPPLLPILLSIVFRLFTACETAAHLFMLTVQLSTACLIYLLASDWLDRECAALAGLLWLTLPVSLHFGQLVAQQSLGMMLVVAALWLLNRCQWASSVCIFLAVCASWEPLLTVPGLWLASEAGPSRRRAAIYSGCAIAGLAFVLGIYAWHQPRLLADSFQTALYRAGLSNSYSKELIPHAAERALPLSFRVLAVMWNNLCMLGFFALASSIFSLLSFRKPLQPSLAALASMWIGWVVLMSNHVAVHDFEMMIAAPFAAITLAWSGRSLVNRWIGIPLFAVIIMQSFLLGATGPGAVPATVMRFADVLKGATPSESVIISPVDSMVPVWYSDRHVVRNINDEESLNRVLPTIRETYPNSPMFLAVPPNLLSSFQQRPRRFESDVLTLESLDTAPVMSPQRVELDRLHRD